MRNLIIFVAFIGFIHAKSSFQNKPLLSCSTLLADGTDEPRLSRATHFNMITIGQVVNSTLMRFWSKIKFSWYVDNCWEWQACTNYFGYGVFQTGHTKKSKNIAAHRYLFTKLFGDLPSHIHVLHTCDNPKCVNPNHLFKGTHAQNVADKMRKGRHRFVIPDNKGSKNANAKITEDNVREIRILLMRGIEAKDIAVQYKISDATISRIKLNHGWSHVK